MAESTLTLSLPALRAVGGLLDGELNPISPMYASEGVGTAGGMEELRRAGVVDTTGSVSGPYLETMTALVAPYSFAQISVYETAVATEHAVFFAASDRRPIALTTTDGGVMIRDPGPNQRIADGLPQLFGMSVLGGTDLSVTVSPDEALALAALLDAYRKQMLTALATDSPISPVDVSEIQACLRDEGGNRQWLLATVKAQLANVPPPEAVDVNAAIGRLTELELVEAGGSSVTLAGAARESLPQMLLVRRGLRLTAGRAFGNKVTFAHFAGISFGMHDMLRLEEISGLLRFDMVSSAQLIGQVAGFLLDPDAMGPQGAEEA